MPYGAKAFYLPTAEREVLARQKAAPRMVPGIFAGYKFNHKGLWTGDYLVYDYEAYQNWTGSYNLPLHTTKEIYLPGQAPDSKEDDAFVFPAAIGEIRSKCTEAPKYVKGKSKKRHKSGSAEATSGRPDDSPAAPANDPEDTIEVADSLRDMFVDLIEDHEKKFERLNGPMETAQAQGSGGPDVETSQVQDDWILQGEYLVRRHFVPRTTLFSPWEWKQNQIAIDAK